MYNDCDQIQRFLTISELYLKLTEKPAIKVIPIDPDKFMEAMNGCPGGSTLPEPTVPPDHPLIPAIPFDQQPVF